MADVEAKVKLKGVGDFVVRNSAITRVKDLNCNG